MSLQQNLLQVQLFELLIVSYVIEKLLEMHFYRHTTCLLFQKITVATRFRRNHSHFTSAVIGGLRLRSIGGLRLWFIYMVIGGLTPKIL
jgi:hypothetical protein